MRDNLRDRMMDKCLQNLDERSSIFSNAQMFTMTNPCILSRPVFRILE